MTDIPQEVREAAPMTDHERFITAVAYDCGYQAGLAAGKRAGMERAAEIADDHGYSLDIDKFAAMTKKEHGAYACRSVAQAIRSEADAPSH